MFSVTKNSEGRYEVEVMDGSVYECATAKAAVRLIRELLDLPPAGRPKVKKDEVVEKA